MYYIHVHVFYVVCLFTLLLFVCCLTQIPEFIGLHVSDTVQDVIRNSVNIFDIKVRSYMYMYMYASHTLYYLICHSIATPFLEISIIYFVHVNIIY